jgi:hypothetical protein
VGGVLASSRIGRFSSVRAGETVRDTWVAFTGKPFVRRLRTTVVNEGEGLPSPSRTPPPRQHGNLLPRAEFPPRDARDRRVSVGTLPQGCPRASSRVNPRRASPRPRPSAGAFRFFFGTRESSRVAMREKKDVEVLRLRAAPPISRRSYPPKTDQITSDTYRVNQTASNPAPSGVQPATQARRTRRDPRLTPGFGHPRGSQTVRTRTLVSRVRVTNPPAVSFLP